MSEARFDKLAAVCAAAAPMGKQSVPVTRRTLLVDGDGLAYYCAGKDGSSIGDARRALIDKVNHAAAHVGAESVIVLLTASGSTKGDRYAVARVKPYQGQRASSRRPDNWRGLRDYMDSSEFPFRVQSTATAEADDLFAWWAYTVPDDVVIMTQDKDMRMLPGLHLDWVTNRVHRVEHRVVETDRPLYQRIRVEDSVFNDKQYGVKWFWLQMLHGDTADNIPGLPKYKTVDAKGNPALKPVGEVTANKLLTGERPDIVVAGLYRGYYEERWAVELLEQAILLWMRREPDDYLDVIEVGGPLWRLSLDCPEFAQAVSDINERVTNARTINSQAAEAS